MRSLEVTKREATEKSDQGLTLSVLQERASRLYSALNTQRLSPVSQQKLLGRGHRLLGFLLRYMDEWPVTLNARFDAAEVPPINDQSLAPKASCAIIFL